MITLPRDLANFALMNLKTRGSYPIELIDHTVASVILVRAFVPLEDIIAKLVTVWTFRPEI